MPRCLLPARRKNAFAPVTTPIRISDTDPRRATSARAEASAHAILRYGGQQIKESILTQFDELPCRQLALPSRALEKGVY